VTAEHQFFLSIDLFLAHGIIISIFLKGGKKILAQEMSGLVERALN